MKNERKRKFLDHKNEAPLQELANREFDGNITRAMNSCVKLGLQCVRLYSTAKLAEVTMKAASDD